MIEGCIVKIARNTAWAIALSVTALPCAAQNGKSIFNANCSICHQANGAGSRGRVPPLHGEHWDYLASERSYPIQVMLGGLSGPILAGGARYDGAMPAFGARLSDAEIAAVANYLGELRGAHLNPSFVPEDVRNLRNSLPTHAELVQLRDRTIIPRKTVYP